MAIRKDKTKREKKSTKPRFFLHPTAIIEDNVSIGAGTKIWHFAQVRTGAKIGRNCIISNSVFIDAEAIIGDNCKIQNHAIIYHPCVVEDGVFIGPNVCLTNDKLPRAITPDGILRSAQDWQSSKITLRHGASIGAHSVITPGVTIGEWAMAGSGSVITRDVPDHALIYGNPARIHGFVCQCGQRLEKIIKRNKNEIVFKCECGGKIKIEKKVYKRSL